MNLTDMQVNPLCGPESITLFALRKRNGRLYRVKLQKGLNFGIFILDMLPRWLLDAFNPVWPPVAFT